MLALVVQCNSPVAPLAPSSQWCLPFSRTEGIHTVSTTVFKYHTLMFVQSFKKAHFVWGVQNHSGPSRKFTILRKSSLKLKLSGKIFIINSHYRYCTGHISKHSRYLWGNRGTFPPTYAMWVVQNATGGNPQRTPRPTCQRLHSASDTTGAPTSYIFYFWSLWFSFQGSSLGSTSFSRKPTQVSGWLLMGVGHPACDTCFNQSALHWSKNQSGPSRVTGLLHIKCIVQSRIH
jgi:hypothetical protein